MITNALRGKRYINLLRGSTNMQDTTTDDQKKVNDRHAQEKLGMQWVDDVTSRVCLVRRRSIVATFATCLNGVGCSKTST